MKIQEMRSVGFGTFSKNTIALGVGGHPNTMSEPNKGIYSFIHMGSGATHFRSALSTQVITALDQGLTVTSQTTCLISPFSTLQPWMRLDQTLAVWLLQNPTQRKAAAVKQMMQMVWLRAEISSVNIELPPAETIEKLFAFLDRTFDVGTPKYRQGYGWSDKQGKEYEGGITIWDIFAEGYAVAVLNDNSGGFLLAKTPFVPIDLPLLTSRLSRAENRQGRWTASRNALVGYSQLSRTTVIEMCGLLPSALKAA